MSLEAPLYHQPLIPTNELDLFKFIPGSRQPSSEPVSYWIPTGGDIAAMAALARSVGKNPTVVDIGCGNAFISHLLAQKVPVIGIDPNKELLKNYAIPTPEFKTYIGSGGTNPITKRYS